MSLNYSQDFEVTRREYLSILYSTLFVSKTNHDKKEIEHFFALPKKCFGKSEDEFWKNKKEWENEKVFILRDGEWVNKEMKRAIDNYILLFYGDLMYVPENYFITLNEFHEKTLEKLMQIEKLNMPNVLDHPEFTDRIEHKSNLDNFFTDIAVFGLRPTFIGKSDKEILSTFGGGFSSFINVPNENNTFTLSEKYGKIFDELYNNPIVAMKRMCQYRKMVQKFLVKDRLSIEKTIDAALLFPSDILTSPCELMYKLVSRLGQRKELKKLGHIKFECPSLELDCEKFYEFGNNVIMEKVVEKVGAKMMAYKINKKIEMLEKQNNPS